MEKAHETPDGQTVRLREVDPARASQTHPARLEETLKLLKILSVRSTGMGGNIFLDGQVTNVAVNQRLGFRLGRSAHFITSFHSETLIKSIIYNTIFGLINKIMTREVTLQSRAAAGGGHFFPRVSERPFS
jgi:hypothetical protein